jgi:signal transduction histidine kinase
MRLRDLRRTTTFRLTVVYGVAFALATFAVLGAVYVQTTAYLTHRVDGILKTHADALVASPPAQIPDRIGEALALNGERTNVYALFSAGGSWKSGNLRELPSHLRAVGEPVEVPPTASFPTYARLIARRLPDGDILVVGRDVDQLREIRTIVASALIWSGAGLLILGAAFGAALSVPALRRLEAAQAAAKDIAAGDLKRRIPAGTGRDELDMFADTVNHMIGEVERLMSEVRSSTDTIAHDLRTPLTRARARLHRLQNEAAFKPEDIARVTAELDEVLDRFRAILRISEIEARERRAGFARVELGGVLARAVDLYTPLAEARGVRLTLVHAGEAVVQADAKLLFEAVSNLTDNAIKFTAPGGEVRVRLAFEDGAPAIVIEDTGPGIPLHERAAVLQRFYRGERARLTPGSGLGLSVVAAIVRLHGYALRLEDASPGLRAVIVCDPHAAVVPIAASAGNRR